MQGEGRLIKHTHNRFHGTCKNIDDASPPRKESTKYFLCMYSTPGTQNMAWPPNTTAMYPLALLYVYASSSLPFDQAGLVPPNVRFSRPHRRLPLVCFVCFCLHSCIVGSVLIPRPRKQPPLSTSWPATDGHPCKLARFTDCVSAQPTWPRKLLIAHAVGLLAHHALQSCL
jgi:hypothetical protein